MGSCRARACRHDLLDLALRADDGRVRYDDSITTRILGDSAMRVVVLKGQWIGGAILDFLRAIRCISAMTLAPILGGVL